MSRAARWSRGSVSAGVLSLVSLLGCGPSVESTTSTGGSSASTGGTSTGNGGTSTGGSATSSGTGGTSTGGGGSGTGASAGSGTGGVPQDPCAANAVDATVYEVTDPNAPGAIVEDVKVRIQGVIAVSDKFLISHSAATGSCLWGVLVSAPSSADNVGPLLEAAPYSGLRVDAYGEDAMNGAPCPIDGGGIPADVKPGDVLNVVGTTSRFLLPSCGAEATNTDIGQARLLSGCGIEKTGVTLPVPAPHLLTADELALLNEQHKADPGAEAFHGAWAAARVRTPATTAKPLAMCGPAMNDACCAAVASCAVDLHGSIFLDQGDTVVSDRLYAKGPAPVCSGPPQFAAPPTPPFAYIQGVVHLDFCTWTLAPIDKCADYSPAPDDCIAAGVVSCL